MTLEKRRNMLKEVGFLLLPRVDLSSYVSFDNLRGYEGINCRLSDEVIDKKIYGEFRPDANTLSTWFLYPSRKRPVAIADLQKIFGAIYGL